MKKAISIFAMVAVSLALFSPALDATVYTGAKYSYTNEYCRSDMKSKHYSKSIGGGTMYYGCYDGAKDKPYTEFKRNNSTDYKARTYVSSGYYNDGGRTDDGALSKNAELTSKQATFQHQSVVYY